MMHSQMNRAITTAIAERVIPEIQNIANSMSSTGHRDTEASMTANSQENRENASGPKTKIAKKDSRSVGDLRNTTGCASYMVTGTIDTQPQIGLVILVIFRRKYVNPESQATAKHKRHRLTFDPSTMKLPDFLEEVNQGAKKAFGENAKSKIDSLLYAKLPPKLKSRSVNMARLENGTYEEIVAHLERELELNALEESDDLPMATMASESTNQSNLLSNGINTNKEAQCSCCKGTGHYYKSCPKLEKE